MSVNTELGPADSQRLEVVVLMKLFAVDRNSP